MLRIRITSRRQAEPVHGSTSGWGEGVSRNSGVAADSGKISLFDLAIVLVRRWRSILSLTLLSIVIATLVALLLPAEYTATVTFFPPRPDRSMETVAARLGSLNDAAEWRAIELAFTTRRAQNANAIYVAMLKSRPIEAAMIQQFGLRWKYHVRDASAARKALEQHIDIDGDTLSGMIRIDVEDSNPREAADMANEYVDQFRKLSKRLAMTGASQQKQFLGQQLEAGRANLFQADEALKRAQENLGLVRPNSQTRALIDLGAELSGQIAATEVQIEALQMYAASDDPALVEAKQRLQAWREQLAKLDGTHESADGLLIGTHRLPQVRLEYERRLRDVRYYETIVDILARQVELATLEEAEGGGLIQVVESATPPSKRSFPKLGQIALGAAVIGFLAGITFAFVSAGIACLKLNERSARKLASLRQQITWRSHRAR